MGRDEVLRVLESHTAELRRCGVKSLRLFGSVARDPLLFLEDIEHDVPALLGARVDLVTENGLRDRVRPYVEKEAIRVA